MLLARRQRASARVIQAAHWETFRALSITDLRPWGTVGRATRDCAARLRGVCLGRAFKRAVRRAGLFGARDGKRVEQDERRAQSQSPRIGVMCKGRAKGHEPAQ